MKERDVFLALLDIETDEARMAFLEQACGNDAALHAKVIALLKSYHNAESFLDEPAVHKFVASADEQSSEFEIATLLQDSEEKWRRAATFINATSASESDSVRQAKGEPTLPQGTTVGYFGDYEIQKELGRGGMGVVYKARQISLNRIVALKMIRSGFLPGDSELRRFQNEAEAVALLDHPGIIPVYEVGDHKGQRFFSMKLIDGGDLGTKLSFYKDNLKAAVALLTEAAEAVHHAHLRGILHRDLKPANILIDAEGHPHVTDFGLAKRVEMDAEMTQSGSILGTPAYMSPEQAAGRRGLITTATDVYGLGAILYALLTGEAPFTDDSLIETLDAVRTKPPEPPTKMNSKVPYDLELICLKCLEKDPARRYPSAAALAADLRRFSAGQPVSVRDAGMVEKFVKWARRKPTLAAAYSLGVMALIFGSFGGVALWQWNVAETALRLAEVAEERARSAQATAVEQKSRAEYSRDEAEASRDESIVARRAANELTERLQHIEYGKTMQLAHQEWRKHHVSETLELLQQTSEDLRGWEWRYVKRLCNSELLTLKGHASEVRSASYSHDGLLIVTASLDASAKVWDATSGEQLFSLPHRDIVTSATFSKDCSQIVTASRNEVIVWDVGTHSELRRMTGPGTNITNASFSPDASQIVGSMEGRRNEKSGAIIWDAKSGAVLMTVLGHAALVPWATFSPDGSKFMTASWDGLTKVWDGKAGAVILEIADSHSIAQHQCACFSPDGAQIAISSTDGMVRLWNATTGSQTQLLKGHLGIVRSASFSSDGLLVASSGEDSTARLWNASTGVELGVLKGHTGNVGSASFSPDGARIVTASKDGTAKVWDATKTPEVITATTGGHAFNAFFVPDNSRVMIDSAGTRMVTELDSLTMTKRDLYSLSKKPARFERHLFSQSRDGSQIAVGRDNGSVALVDTNTAAEVLRLHGHKSRVNAASHNSNGTRIVTASDDQTARVWDTGTGRELFRFSGHCSRVVSAQFHLDDDRITTTEVDGTVKVWSSNTGVELLTLSCLAQSSSFSTDGKSIATTQLNDNTVRVRDVVSGTERLILRGHTGPVNSVDFSPDMSRIVTASEDWKVKIWNAMTGAELLSLEGHENSVKSARFSQDGCRIVSAAFDGTVKIWDAGPNVPSIPKQNPETPQEHPRLATDRVQGTYARFPVDNSWHTGRILVNESPSGESTLRWLNRKGVHWTLNPDHRKGVLLTTPDCVYFHQPEGRFFELIFDQDKAGSASEMIGFRFGGSEYLRVPEQFMKGELAEKNDVAQHKRKNPVTSLSFSPNNSCLISGYWDGSLRVRDIAAGAWTLQMNGHSDVIRSISYSSDGKCVVTGSADQTAKVWDTETGTEQSSLTGHTDVVSCVAFSPDGSRIATGSWDRTGRVWDRTTGELLLTFEKSPDLISSVSFSHDGTRILMSDSRSTILPLSSRIWDASNGACIESFNDHGLCITTDFCRDRLRILKIKTGQLVTGMLDVATQAQVQTLKSQASPITFAVYSVDGSRFLTVDLDRLAKIWDATTGDLVFKLNGPARVITSASLNADGSRIATGNWDGTIQLWDGITGDEIGSF